MKKKILGLTLFSASVFLALTSCGNNNAGPSAKNPMSDHPVHYVEGTIHDVLVNETSNVFVQDGQTEYKLYYDHTVDGLNTYANFLAKQVKSCTGAELPILSDEDVDFDLKPLTSNKFIILGNKDLFESYHLVMPTNININGYYIKSVGTSVMIEAKTLNGYDLGVIAFLREVLGYDMLSDDCVVFEKSGEFLPNMEITEEPDIPYYDPSSRLSKEAIMGQGWSTHSLIQTRTYPDPEDLSITTDVKGGYHNYFNYVPYALKDVYPEWFYIGQDINNSQLCLNAHGNETLRQKLINRIAQIMIKEANDNLDCASIAFTQIDNYNWCNCDACNAVKAKYGSNSASAILFLNEVDTIVQAELQRQAEEAGTTKRDLDIIFFAYLGTQQAPTSLGEHNECHCHKTVVPMIAPLNAIYTYSFYESCNDSDSYTYKTWAQYADVIDSWTYCTNFHNYLYPYDTFYAQVENARFMREYNVKFSFPQGQTGAPHENVTAFGKLKDYLTSKSHFDVNMDYNHYVNKFFKYYFLENTSTMRDFFDTAINWVNHLSQIYSSVLPGTIYEEVAKNESYWPKGVVLTLTNLIDKAYGNILPLSLNSDTSYQYDENTLVVSNSSTSIYDAMKRHILLESIFPRFVNCELRQGDFSSDVLASMRSEFKKDCVELSIKLWREGTSFLIAGLWE